MTVQLLPRNKVTHFLDSVSAQLTLHPTSEQAKPTPGPGRTRGPTEGRGSRSRPGWLLRNRLGTGQRPCAVRDRDTHLLEPAGGVHADHGAWPQQAALMQSQAHKVGCAVGGRTHQNPTVRQGVVHLHQGTGDTGDSQPRVQCGAVTPTGHESR